MSRLSALQAFRAGREEVPGYISGDLIKAKTRKGLTCWYDEEMERWVYNEDSYGEAIELPREFKPVVGEACFLGAMGVAMGIDPAQLADQDSFYAHPDFYLDPLMRKHEPDGFVYSSSGPYIELKTVEFPCKGHETLGAASPLGVASTSRLYDKAKPVPEVIAHLNDQHDPRFETSSKTFLRPKMVDPWTEERIVEWLRSLGYNGDHGKKGG